MSPSVNEEASILKQALLRLLESIKDPSRQEAEKIIGHKALSILGKVRVNKKPTEEKVSEAAQKSEQEEVVRQALRDAETSEDISAAIEKARDLGMNFEASLGEKKLIKLTTSMNENETVSSRE